MWEQVLANYCERAGRPEFWAEPLNAVTNAGFVAAGGALLAIVHRDARSGTLPRNGLSLALAALIVIIGIGSFLFHTTAYRWAAMADTIPIMIFMLTAVYTLAVRGFGTPRWGGPIAIILFIALGAGSARLGALLRETPFGSFGGVFAYGPALLVLIASGVVLWLMEDQRRSAAGRRLAAAGAVFALSLTLRTVDRPFCDLWTLGGVPIGTHFLWHLLNALTLYLTASALVRLAPGADVQASALRSA